MKKAMLFLFLFHSLIISSVSAQMFEITTGLNYLNSTQNPDGSWGDETTSTEILPSTVSVIEILQILNQTGGTNYTNAVSWLQSEGLDTTDYLSERIHALSVAGTDMALILLYIDESGSAWGVYDDFGVDNFDTIFALSALKRINYSGQTVIQSAIDYLISSQNTDGGWGLKQGKDSEVYCTALVSITLQQFPKTTSIATAINRATAYNIANQNTDGGFGSTTSTVYETALSYLALVGVTTNATVLGNAINYLTSTQLTNGSWENDPYSTALAMRALANVKPNLSISSTDIIFSNPTPTIGETITVSANVKNTGTAQADNVPVQFYDGDPLAGGVLIGETTIPSISAFGSSQTSIDYTIPTASSKTIFIKIDPLNTIDELDEEDNIASKNLTSATLPDLSITSADITFSPSSPVPNQPVIVSVSIRNMGEAGASNVTVELYDGAPSAGGVNILTTIIPSIGPGTYGTVQLTTTFSAGTHNLYAVVDSANAIQEGNETNNTAMKVFLVEGGIDLVITRDDIFFSPAYPVEGNQVTIAASINNGEEEQVTNVLVRFYLGDPDAGGVQIGADTIITSILARSTVSINTTWDTTGQEGNKTLYVKVDPLETISEINESNNKAFRTVKVAAKTGPDLTLSTADINLTPLTPNIGDTVTITANIRNTGTADANNVFVEFSLGDPEVGGTLIIGSTIVPFIAQGNTALAQFTLDTTGFAGAYELYVNIDPFNEIAETNETNNMAHATLEIKAPQGPDVTITSIDTTNLITNTQSLAVSGLIKITIKNKGNQPTNAPFKITTFEDRNSNKVLDTGTDNILGVITYTNNFLAGATDTIDIPVSGNILFRDNLIYVIADSGNALSELDETNNTRSTGQQCEYIPPVGTFSPKEKWAWTGGSSVMPQYNQVMHTPVVANLTDDNGDGLINEEDVPDIIFGTFYGDYCTGVLRAISGDTGREIFTISSPMVSTCSSFAVGDIDNDGKVEIIARKPGGELGSGIVVFEHDGTFKWKYDNVFVGLGGPSIADLDNDGKPEIIVGATVLNNDGTLKWQGTGGIGSNAGLGPFSVVADIDLDGHPEVVGGNTAYRYNGTIYWRNTTIPDGYNAVANFDDDPYPEIVVVSSGYIYLLKYNGTKIWGPVLIPYGYRGGAPTIADFDGDGKPEIGVAGSARYVVFKSNGSILWQSVTRDYSSYVTGSSVFDFDGDGQAEVVYNDEQYLRIYKGTDGTVLFSTPNSTYTLTENPIIADVDNDNRAEIVVCANTPGPFKTHNGIRVFEDANDNWVNTRKIWNQHTYHITNVNDDGTIPRYEENNWEIYNNYRCNSLLPDEVFGTADITASYITVDQTNYPISVTISTRIGNGGAVSQVAGVDIGFYDGDPNQGGILIGTKNTTEVLDAGGYEDISITWNNPSSGNHTLFVIADKDNHFNECREGNNKASTEVFIGIAPPVYYPDLSISQTDITIVPPDLIEGQEAGIGAVIHNIGNADAYNIEVTFYDGDASTGALINTVQIPFIQAGGTSYVQIPWNTFGQSGRNYIHGIIDPQNLISESNENNNASLVAIDVTPPTKPDLTITSTDIVFSHHTPKEGDPLSITATIHNLGTNADTIKVNLYDGAPENGGTLLDARTILSIIPFGGQAAVQFNIDTVGFSGNHSFHIVIDPENTIDEQREDNNRATANLLIGSIGLTLTETTDKTRYTENEDVLITVNITDLRNQLRELKVDIRVFDAGGFLAGTLPSQSITLNPHETRTLNFTWNTGNTLTGNYTVRATAYDTGMNPVAKAFQPISIVSTSGITTNLVLNKISYRANEQASITSTVTNSSANMIYTDLTATVTIRNTAGRIIQTEDTPIGILTPSSDHTFNTSWNIGTNPPGAYQVTLTVKDQSGTVLSTSTKDLTISSEIKPSVLLRGQISVDKQIILQSEPLNITYSVRILGTWTLHR